MVAIEKRRYPRVPVEWPVAILTSEKSVQGEIRNISLVGAFINCLIEFKREPLHLLIKVPHRGRCYSIAAEVAWSNIHESAQELTLSGTGVRFTSFFEESRSLVFKAVNDYLRSQQKKTLTN